MNYIAGVDIGGTNTKIGIVDEDGEILVKKSIKTLSLEGAEKTMTKNLGNNKRTAFFT